jgi:hypothetical protein
MLATTIRRAVDASSNVTDKEQILTATMAIRTSPRRRWSLRSFADEYLSGATKETFLNAAPNSEGRNSMFDFRRSEFERFLAYRVYTLETGVLISSPFQEVGRSVLVEGHDERRLSCEGTVVDEKVRTRHG